MGCLRSMAKYILFLFNLVIVLAALAFIIVGVIFKLHLDKEVFKNEEDIKALAIAPILLIVMGCIIFFIAFLGCCGAVKKNSCMLTTYGIILLVILAVQLAVAIFAFVQSNNEDYKVKIEKAIAKDIKNYDKNPAVKEYLDLIQENFECCGVYGRKDYISAGVNVPQSCKQYSNGCGDKVYDFLMKNVKIVGIVAIVICAIELLGSIFAFWVANGHKRGMYA